jgi:hypothetical protein
MAGGWRGSCRHGEDANYAWVRITPDGTITILSAGAEMGHGSIPRTKGSLSLSLADEIIELAAIWNVVARIAQRPSALRSRIPVNEDVDNGLGRSAICVCVPVRYRR